MDYNKKEIIAYLCSVFLDKNIRYEIHDFPSASMIDIWYKENFYVIQLESDLIGFSLVNENTGFDTRPNEVFLSAPKFIKKINEVFSSSL